MNAYPPKKIHDSLSTREPMTERMMKHIEIMHGDVSTIESILSKLVGEDGADVGGPSPVPSGAIGRIEESLSTLAGRIARASQRLSQI